MSSAAEILFWASVALVFYVYLGYPALLVALRLVIRRPVDKRPNFPFVSLLIPAYNEVRSIREKIRNSLDLDYPQDLIEIVIASDGSTDGTAEAAAEFACEERIRLFAYPKNRGKISTMNDTFPELKGEIVVFSDASSMLMPDAVREIVQNFYDARVGAVSGVYQVKQANDSSTGGAEKLYWKYETFVRMQESALDSLLGGHGHLYAIRKSLYFFPPPGTINDDYVIPVRIVSRGYRAVYETKAIGWEQAEEMAGFRRRVRIMAGNVQQLRELPRLLRRPLPLFFFFSHKAGRLVVPFGMLAAFLSSAILAGRPMYRAGFAAQVILYLLAGAGALFPIRPRILRLPYYFTMINLATFVGIYHALGFGRGMAWK
jgi:cellulose synthase/poly-beta-1,6-N-acetylglucosamine synthase-like glycosyltransferase